MIKVIGILVGLSVLLVFVFWIARRAPEGYEDSTGFHYGAAQPEPGRALSGDSRGASAQASQPVSVPPAPAAAMLANEDTLRAATPPRWPRLRAAFARCRRMLRTHHRRSTPASHC